MSRQSSNMPEPTDAPRKAPGRKDRPYELWLTAGRWTFRGGWYRSAREAHTAGRTWLRNGRWNPKHSCYMVERDGKPA